MHQRERLDRVGQSEIFVEPVHGSAINAEVNDDGQLWIHLGIVTESGGAFHTSDLERMALNPSNVAELLELCERRTHTLKEKYLPCTVDPRVMKMHCYIDSKECVIVEIILTAHTRPT